MEDVAALARVSTSTVSRALRGSPLISAGTRERVRKAAEQLDFAVSRTASALASGRLGRIGVLVSGPLNTWFNSSVLEAVYASLREAGRELVIYRIRDAADRTEFFATLPARRNVDALIVASFALRPDERARLAELSVPVIYLNQRVADHPCVFIDDAAAAATGTRHLLHLGHRRVAYVTTRTLDAFSFSASSRFAGVRHAIEHHNRHRPEDPADPPSHLVVDALGGGPEVGQLAVGRLLSGETVPTAVVAETDEIAMSLLPALARAGLRVPADVSVLGFDDNALAPLFDLTTVAQPVTELGRQSAEVALALSPGTPLDSTAPDSRPPDSRPKDRDHLHRELPTRLVLRGSTAVPALDRPA